MATSEDESSDDHGEGSRWYESSWVDPYMLPFMPFIAVFYLCRSPSNAGGARLRTFGWVLAAASIAAMIAMGIAINSTGRRDAVVWLAALVLALLIALSIVGFRYRFSRQFNKKAED